MARLDPPFRARPRNVHTAEPLLELYDTSVPGRWDVHDDANRLEGETDEHYRERGWLAAVYWSGQDRQAGRGEEKGRKAAPRGRPRELPTLPGETAEERRKRLNRERVRRHHANRKAGDPAANYLLTVDRLHALAMWAHGLQAAPGREEVLEYLVRA